MYSENGMNQLSKAGFAVAALCTWLLTCMGMALSLIHI